MSRGSAVIAALILFLQPDILPGQSAEDLAGRYKAASAGYETGFVADRSNLDGAYLKRMNELAATVAEAKAEVARFEGARAMPETLSGNPEIHRLQETYATASGKLESRRQGVLAALASEYLLRLASSGKRAEANSEREALSAVIDLSKAEEGRTGILPSNDAFIRSGSYQNENYGNLDHLMVRQAPSGGSRRTSFLRFDLRNAPRQIDNARLRLVCVSNPAAAQRKHMLNPFAKPTEWDEYTITYATRPERKSDAPLVEWTTPMENQVVYLDVTALVRAKRGRDAFDLIIATESTQYIAYGSKENADEWARPRLLINDPGALMVAAKGGSLPAFEVFDSPSGDTSSAPIFEMTERITQKAPEKDMPVKGAIKQIKGLLISEIGTGKEIGMAQNLTVTAIKSGGGAPMEMSFNQKVGDSMRKALDAVARGLQIRYGAWPHGYTLEFAFEEKYVPKDGPSAAVACALLLDALVHDSELASDFAVTGDLNPDLAVEPIGGVKAKIVGAAKRKCTVVALPVGNVQGVEDMAAMGDFTTLGSIQIFSVATFDEARDLAMKERPEALAKSIAEFAELQTKGLSAVTPDEAKALLAGIVERTPTHVSARLILQRLLGTEPKRLSLVGSFNAIDQTSGPFLDALRADRAESIVAGEFQQAMIDLQQVRRKLDPRTLPLHQAITDILVFLRRTVDKTYGNRTEYEAAEKEINMLVKRYDNEIGSLRTNVEIQKELSR